MQRWTPPKSFFKKKAQFRLVRTADPSGILLDPADLFNYPDKPYFTVVQIEEDVKDEPRVLIFADHFHTNRLDNEKDKIYDKIKEAKQLGFQILCLQPDGKLVEMDLRTLDEDYELPLKTFTADTISDLAWTQHELGSSDFYLLDFFGINELLDFRRGEVNFEKFPTTPDDILAMMMQSTENEFWITLGRTHLNDYAKLNFKKLAAQKKLNFVLSFDQDNVRYARKFKNFKLEGITLMECKLPAEFYPISETFKSMRQINLAKSGEDIFPEFLQVAIELEKLTMNYQMFQINLNILFDSLKGTNRIKELDLSHNFLTATLSKFSSAFSMPELEKLSLDETDMSLSALSHLLKAAKKLKSLSLQSCNQLHGDFSAADFPVENLTEIYLSHVVQINSELALHLLQAPKLKTMTISSGNGARVLPKLKPNSLQHLTQVDANESYVTAKELAGLFQAAPNLDAVSLRKAELLDDLVLPPNFRLKLKRLDLTDVKITPKNLERLRRIVPSGCEILDTGIKLTDKEKEQKTDITPPSEEKKSDVVDPEFFDTKEITHELPFKEFFPGIHPSLYRLGLYELDLDSVRKPIPIFPNDFDTSPHKPKNPKEYPFIYPGVKPIEPAMGVKIILPSLNVDEYVHQVILVDEHGRTVKEYEEKEIKPSQSTGFSKIILPESGKFTVHFKIGLKNNVNADNIHTLPPTLKQFVSQYREHDVKEMPEKKFTNWHDFSRVLRQRKTGHCEHRSYAGYAQLIDEFKFERKNVRLRDTGPHMMVEAFMDDKWHELDLGGYAADVAKEPMEVHTPIKKEEKSSEPVFLRKYAADTIKKIPFDDAIKEAKTVLFIAEKSIDIEQILSKLNEQKQDIFPAHTPHDVSMIGQFMQRDGTFIPTTRFKEWMKNRTHGFICIDMREFEDNEVVQLNELLGKKLEKDSGFPEGITFKLIDRPGRKYGPGFSRRVHFKCMVSTSEPTVTPVTVEDEKALEIDLCHSPYWKMMLSGSWIPTPAKKRNWLYLYVGRKRAF